MIRNFKYMLMAAGFGLVAQTATAAPWIKAESEHFVIYSHNGKDQTRAYASRLESFYLVTGDLYDQLSDSVLPAFEKTRFNYMGSVDEFRVVDPDLKGVSFYPYMPGLEGTQYFSTADGQDNNDLYAQGPIDPKIDLNVAYMYLGYNSHILHERFSKLPGWVSNGLNWYFMTMVIRNDEAVIGRPPPNIAMSIKSDRIDSLLREKTKVPYADRIADKPMPFGMEDMATLEDWVMVSYLMETPERRQHFKDYLRLLNEGAESRAAYDKTIAIDPASYADVLKTYSNKGVPTLVYQTGQLPQAGVAIAALPDYPMPVPMIDAALQTSSPSKIDPKYLDSLRKLAPRFPEDTLAQTALARAEIYLGNPEAAQPYLQSRLKADPKDFEAQFLMGRLHLALAEDGPADGRGQNYIQARIELGKAYKLNPASAPTLYLYARAFADQPDYPDANTMNALLLAQDYSGSNYDLYEAELHLRQGDYAKAQAIIEKCLSLATPKWSKTRLETLTAIRDGLSAKTQKPVILALFETYKKLRN